MAKVATLPAEAYVYVIGAEDGPMKVGVAANAASRCAMLQTGNPFGLTVLHKVLIPRRDVFLVERYAHDLLSSDRIRGEWFDVDADEAIAAVDAAFEAYRTFGFPPDTTSREAMAWQRRLKVAGLTQAELARIAGKRENAVSEGLRGKGKGGVPVYLQSLIRLWESCDRKVREEILANPVRPPEE